MDPRDADLLDLTQRLLDAIAGGNWPVYESLTSRDMTCFEPEACGQLVHGQGFHRYYFAQRERGAIQTTMVQPHIRWLGADAAVVSYVRLIQHDGGTTPFEETRVWQRVGSDWKNVHFHRSRPADAPGS